jgi:hypothetical protein
MTLLAFWYTVAVGLFLAIVAFRQPAVFAAVLIPVAISALAHARRYSRVVVSIAAVAMLGFVCLGTFSVGPYYFPSALLLLVAIVTRPKREEDFTLVKIHSSR